MLPSFIYPTISSTKLTIFVVRHTGRRKRAGHRNQLSPFRFKKVITKNLRNIETVRISQNMLSLHCTRNAAAHKIYRTLNNRAQPELWTEIVNACPIIWQNMLSLHYTRSAAAHKIYRTLNNRAQPELWTEIVNACPIIDCGDPPSFAGRCAEQRR